MLPVKKTKQLVKNIRIKAKTFKLLSPTNLESEREIFLRKTNYNPYFKYPKYNKKDFKTALEKLKNVETPEKNELEKWFWERRLKETKLKIALILAIGNPEKITEISKALYRSNYKKEAIESAEKDSKIEVNSYSKENLDAEDTAEIFEKYLQKNHDTDKWQIRIKKNASFYIQIRYKKNLITINNKINWGWASLDSTLAHEIDGHIVRALNTEKQEGVFKNPLPFYIKTEEGLASYLADYHAENCEISRKHHAVKFLGGVLALKSSFREVYNFFLDNGFGPELAFKRAMRLKKGFTDTSEPGCNAREAMYYEGMLEVKDYIENGGDVQKLFAGKVGLEDLKYIPTPKDPVIPSRLVQN